MTKPLYSIGTWDTDLQAYTPQCNQGSPWLNITIGQLKNAMRELRCIGYSCHRYRDADGSHEDNDINVLIERTDGKSESEVLESWKR